MTTTSRPRVCGHARCLQYVLQWLFSKCVQPQICFSGHRLESFSFEEIIVFYPKSYKIMHSDGKYRARIAHGQGVFCGHGVARASCCNMQACQSGHGMTCIRHVRLLVFWPWHASQWWPTSAWHSCLNRWTQNWNRTVSATKKARDGRAGSDLTIDWTS